MIWYLGPARLQRTWRWSDGREQVGRGVWLEDLRKAHSLASGEKSLIAAEEKSMHTVRGRGTADGQDSLLEGKTQLCEEPVLVCCWSWLTRPVSSSFPACKVAYGSFAVGTLDHFTNCWAPRCLCVNLPLLKHLPSFEKRQVLGLVRVALSATARHLLFPLKSDLLPFFSFMVQYIWTFFPRMFFLCCRYLLYNL